jgi:hypothetical protein
VFGDQRKLGVGRMRSDQLFSHPVWGVQILAGITHDRNWAGPAVLSAAGCIIENPGDCVRAQSRNIWPCPSATAGAWSLNAAH